MAEPKSPLTRQELLDALKAFLACDGSGEPRDEDLDTWTMFMWHRGDEVVALALAAIDRLEPRRPGMKYTKHKLGRTQERIVKFLKSDQWRTTTEIAEALGGNYQNIRRMLPVLHARGFIENRVEADMSQRWRAVRADPEPIVLPAEPPPEPGLPLRQRAQEHLEAKR